MRRAIVASQVGVGTRVIYLLGCFEIREALPQVVEFPVCRLG
jgi:hypothetical protein